VAIVALFAAIGGIGYAAAKLPKNSVGAKQIKDGSVTGSEVKDGSLASSDIGGQLPRGPQGPQGPQGPAGPNGVGPGTGVFRDASVSITSQAAATPTTVATLSNLPAGAYYITAKTIVDLGGPMVVTCRLLAPATGGGDVDEAAVGGSTASNGPMSMQVLHQVPAGTQDVRVSCSKNNSQTAGASQTKIQAVRLSSVTANSSVGG
jgi:hypothetical protein